MKKLLSLLGAFGLSATGAATVVSCNTGDKDVTADQAAIDAVSKAVEGKTFKTPELAIAAIEAAALEAKLVKNTEIPTELTDLGYKVTVVTPEVKADEVEKLSYTLEIFKAVEVKEETEKDEETKPTLEFAKEAVNTKVINVVIGEEAAKELSTVLTVTNLGELKDKETKTILEAAKAKNADLNTEVLKVTLTETGATIEGNDATVYTGKVDVTFTVKAVEVAEKLSDVLTVTNLGELKDNETKTILEAAKAKNADLNTEVLEVTEATEEGATIKSKDEKVYTGEVVVTFTVIA